MSPYFVLTAAHCFHVDDQAPWVTVEVGAWGGGGVPYGGGPPGAGGPLRARRRRAGPRVQRKVDRLFLHPQYNLGGRRDRGVPEFYDYDVALVRLQTAVPPSPTTR